MGMRLAGLYRAAGLPAPSMLGMSRVETGTDSPAYEYLAQTAPQSVAADRADRRGDERTDRHRHARGPDARAGRGGERGPSRVPELIAAWTRVPR